jgi:hypothetical protein
MQPYHHLWELLRKSRLAPALPTGQPTRRLPKTITTSTPSSPAAPSSSSSSSFTTSANTCTMSLKRLRISLLSSYMACSFSAHSVSEIQPWLPIVRIMFCMCILLTFYNFMKSGEKEIVATWIFIANSVFLEFSECMFIFALIVQTAQM